MEPDEGEDTDDDLSTMGSVPDEEAADDEATADVDVDDEVDAKMRSGKVKLNSKLRLKRLRPFDQRVLTNPEKTGVIYLSLIPPNMNVALIRQYFSQYGTLGRIYLEPEKHFATSKIKRKAPSGDAKVKRLKFVEGWVEYLNKADAKNVAFQLNNQPVGGKKRLAFHDTLWNIKYLHRFKWTNLTERLAHEKATRQQRLRIEIDQAKRVTGFYKQNVEKSRMLNRIASQRQAQFKPLNKVYHKQTEPDMSEDAENAAADDVDEDVAADEADTDSKLLLPSLKKSFTDKMNTRIERNKRKRKSQHQKGASEVENSDFSKNKRAAAGRHVLSDATLQSLFTGYDVIV